MSGHRLTGRTRDQTRIPGRPEAESSEVVLRNYDHERSYAVRIELTPVGDGEVVAETYELHPGEVRCLPTLAPRGRTRVTARLGPDESDTTVGRLGDIPARTALVELGNGSVSVTHGI